MNFNSFGKRKLDLNDDDYETSKFKPTFCKVCLGTVQRRKEYCPTVCEACQKFFRRNCENVPTLSSCTSAGWCLPDTFKKRIFCGYCRFQRCLSVGMRSKFLGTGPAAMQKSPPSSVIENKTPSDASMSVLLDETVIAESQDFTSSNNNCPTPEAENKTTTIVPYCEMYSPPKLVIADPFQFDGSSIEAILRTSIRTFPLLHDLEFLPLKNSTEPIVDIPSFFERGSQNFALSMATVRSYGSELANLLSNIEGGTGHNNISEEQIKSLSAGSAVAINCVYGNLVASQGSSFMSMSDETRDSFLNWFPEFRETNEMCNQLANALQCWKPSLVESCLLFSYLFFSGNNADPASLRLNRRFRDRLLLAFNLYCSSRYHHRCAPDEVARTTNIETSRRHFANCFRLVTDISAQTQRSLANIASQSSFFEHVSNVLVTIKGEEDQQQKNNNVNYIVS